MSYNEIVDKTPGSGADKPNITCLKTPITIFCLTISIELNILILFLSYLPTHQAGTYVYHNDVRRLTLITILIRLTLRVTLALCTTGAKLASAAWEAARLDEAATVASAAASFFVTWRYKKRYTQLFFVIMEVLFALFHQSKYCIADLHNASLLTRAHQFLEHDMEKSCLGYTYINVHNGINLSALFFLFFSPAWFNDFKQS